MDEVIESVLMNVDRMWLFSTGHLGQCPFLFHSENIYIYRLWHPTCHYIILTCCGGIFLRRLCIHLALIC